MINEALLGAGATSSASDEPTLDQLLAEPIVRQLMRRDGIDEATIRHLLQETAAARLASLANDGRRDYSVDDITEILERVRTWPPEGRRRAAEVLIALESAGAVDDRPLERGDNDELPSR
jgi:hypothetical protein